MDIKKYISSGILEQYVLSMASEEERQEVEMYARAYPEVKKELEAIEIAMEKYAIAHQLPKPSGVEAKFNQQIDKLIKTNPKPNNNNPSIGTGGIWLPIILGIGLLGTSLLAFFNYQNRQTVQAELMEVRNEYTLLQTNCDETNQENNLLKERLNILFNPDNKVIKLGGTPNNPEALASVIWNPEAKKSYLHINKLELPPTDKDYQLWAIVDGAPVDMGVFKVDVNSDGLQEVPFIENPAAFAISLETAGGNPTPNMDAIQVIGNT